MGTDEKLTLDAGDSLYAQSLVSPNGAYALEHRRNGTIVLRDNRGMRDVWQIGEPMPAAGRLTLCHEGYLALQGHQGTQVWSSGEADRRVTAAQVRDDGRLVLVDPDGIVRWSHDPLGADVLAGCQPASGDRLQRGEILADSIISPDGRYTLTHTLAGETLLLTPSDEEGRSRHVWARRAGQPGAAITLGEDGVLRAGTDSTVLQRWTGRFLLDPMAFVISAVVVRDVGDVVLLDEEGNEIFDSRTAAEESRLAKLRRQYARRETGKKAKPVRQADSGLPRDWFDLLDLSGPSTITWVEGIGAREALLRLGAQPATVRSMTYNDLVSEAFSGDDDDAVRCALAVPVDNWVMLIEPCGIEGMERVQDLSERTQTIVHHMGFDGECLLAWYRNNEPIAVYGDDEAELLERGEPALEGTDPKAMVPFMRKMGLGLYRREDDGDFLPPPVEVACLISGVTPGTEHFLGAHLGAVFGTW
ncbi:DUF6461 domain-containing protein [Streptomyces sp. TRM75561]|uniref:DUF6461 domain-containing protein n=1 Tax=Streptomyces sp. TRM75561 TaxID=2975269 RepID=UPI002449E4F1|nr:DUF6461 domain-containing protein [Streptomyces sp. TRM75561]MDH3039212.1 DUF6461 domain-containing protein [Streptomyces sp. TRM75561]